MGDNIHQPLGQNRKLARLPAGRPRRAWTRPLLSVAALCLVIGGAAWMSLSGSGIGVGEPTLVATQAKPEPATPDPSVDIASGEAGSAADTPAVDESLSHLSGQSGADIAITLDDDGEEIHKISPVQRPDNRPVLLKAPGQVGQNPRLAHLPDPAVIETTAEGKLPVRGPDGERAFDVYARPWSGTRGTRVVIIVGGLGLSQTGTQYAIKTLPEEITLAFASNGNSLQRWMQEARRAGHEILLQVPFEPIDYPANDPGAGTLTVEAGAEANLADLHRAMARTTNYTGITNFMGGRFLADADALEPIMRDIAARGIMFVDDGTSARSLTDQFAKTLGIPFAASDMVLDATQERGYILSRLDDLERTARRNGTAIGVASAFDVSVDAIAIWAEEARARGIEIVSASAAADDPER
ncbi:divergent polysaccharide deacetylase family protein [Hoeflea ulvae]|uniref:Divergent polysaccharide deacetylase family protein n=1 Tax=Hoeflea ulvae TaxID=2983764 RepID=A0ABT3Y9Q3_9HYPH|nr:divergent polysaccharide deacetylase family protein [Hoeflea ulvae]MCY0092618.1 divergent polysaccharide deacetylase family protein [Hoeflea ulvae]